jgi:hypothetical protein
MPSLKTPTTVLDPSLGAPRQDAPQGKTRDLPSVRPNRRLNEHRSCIRVSSSLPVNVKFGGVYELLGQALDLSARGMLFQLERKLPLGSLIELVFRLPREVVGPGSIWLRCHARIVRVQSGNRPGTFRLAAVILSYEVFRVS